jgi:hypothetical protein
MNKAKFHGKDNNLRFSAHDKTGYRPIERKLLY